MGLVKVSSFVLQSTRVQLIISGIFICHTWMSLLPLIDTISGSGDSAETKSMYLCFYVANMRQWRINWYQTENHLETWSNAFLMYALHHSVNFISSLFLCAIIALVTYFTPLPDIPPMSPPDVPKAWNTTAWKKCAHSDDKLESLINIIVPYNKKQIYN